MLQTSSLLVVSLQGNVLVSLQGVSLFSKCLCVFQLEVSFHFPSGGVFLFPIQDGDELILIGISKIWLWWVALFDSIELKCCL